MAGWARTTSFTRALGLVLLAMSASACGLKRYVAAELFDRRPPERRFATVDAMLPSEPQTFPGAAGAKLRLLAELEHVDDEEQRARYLGYLSGRSGVRWAALHEEQWPHAGWSIPHLQRSIAAADVLWTPEALWVRRAGPHYRRVALPPPLPLAVEVGISGLCERRCRTAPGECAASPSTSSGAS